MVNVNTFGKNLRKIRENKGYSINELAKISGINHSNISKIELGVIYPPSDTATILVNSLNIGFDECFGYYNNKKILIQHAFRQLNEIENDNDLEYLYKALFLLFTS